MTTAPPPYKTLREWLHLSQRQVERELGWFEGHRGRLSQIERGLVPSDADRETLDAFFAKKMQEGGRG